MTAPVYVHCLKYWRPNLGSGVLTRLPQIQISPVGQDSSRILKIWINKAVRGRSRLERLVGSAIAIGANVTALCFLLPARFVIPESFPSLRI